MDFERTNANEWNEKQTLPTCDSNQRRNRSDQLSRHEEELARTDRPTYELGSHQQYTNQGVVSSAIGAHRGLNRQSAASFPRRTLNPQVPSFQPPGNQRRELRGLPEVDGFRNVVPQEGQFIQQSPARAFSGDAPTEFQAKGSSGVSKSHSPIANQAASISVQDVQPSLGHDFPSKGNEVLAPKLSDELQNINSSRQGESISPEKDTEKASTKTMLLRQKPNGGLLAPFAGYFIWPSEDIPISSLGPQCKRLDTVRRDHQCHIIFDEDNSAFQIYGDNTSNISEALEGLKLVLRESLADITPPRKAIVVDPPAYHLHNRVVMLNADDRIAPSHAACLPKGKAAKVARVIRAPVDTSYARVWEKKMPALEALQIRVLRMALLDLLTTSEFLQKRVQMRCTLGVFVWESYWWQPKEAQDQPVVPFVENIKDPRTQGALQGLTSQAYLLKRVMQCDTLFRPRDSNIQKLADIEPVYQGWFTLQNTESLDGGLVQLSVTASEDKYGRAHITRRQWLNHPSGDGGGLPFEICVARLHRYGLYTLTNQALTEKSGLSWKLDATACALPIRSNLGDDYKKFAYGVKVNEEFKTWTVDGETSLAFDFLPSEKVKDFTQKTIWRFCHICDRDLIVDVVKIDRLDTMKRNPSHSRQVLQSEWKAEVYRGSWDAFLSGPLHPHSVNNRSDVLLEKLFPGSGNAQHSVSNLEHFVGMMRNIVDTISQVRVT